MTEETPQSAARTCPPAPKLSLLAYLLSYPYFLFFFLMLVAHEIGFRLAIPKGLEAIEKVSRSLNKIGTKSLAFLGGKVHYEGLREISKNPGGFLIVSNHQSLFDVCILYHMFENAAPRFIAKKQLGGFVPGVSTCLQNDGSAIIDREDPKQALTEIARFGKFVDEQGVAAIIFPEGTRARDGKMKRFKKRGLQSMLKHASNAEIIPVAIDNSWKYSFHKLGPNPLGVTIKVKVLPSIKREDKSREEILEECESVIENALSEMRTS